MAIIRRKRNSGFSIINNEALQDNGLSLKAKGLFSYFMTLPEDWSIHTKEVIKHSTDGRDATLSAIKELEVAGYLTRKTIRIDGVFKGTEYIVYDKKL